jgi:hypothetical protein
MVPVLVTKADVSHTVLSSNTYAVASLLGTAFVTLEGAGISATFPVKPTTVADATEDTNEKAKAAARVRSILISKGVSPQFCHNGRKCQ